MRPQILTTREILSFPKYMEGEFVFDDRNMLPKRLMENFVMQQAFFQDIWSNFLDARDNPQAVSRSVEIDYVNENGQLRVYFNLLGYPSDLNLAQVILNRSWPEEYHYSQGAGHEGLEENAVSSFQANHPTATHTADIARRMHLSFLADNSYVRHTQNNPRSKVLPIQNGTPVKNNTEKRYCFPYLQHVREILPEKKRFFKLLAASAVPVMFRLSIKNFTPWRMATAMDYFDFLRVFLRVNELKDHENALHFYEHILVENQLKIFMDVTTQSSDLSIQIATAFIAEFGGNSFFNITSFPESGVPTQTEQAKENIKINGFPNDFCNFPKTESECTVISQPNLSLAMLPQMYAWDEAMVLMKFPFATLHGLPGLKSHPVLPFSRPHQLDTNSNEGKISLGKYIEGKENGDTHCIPLKDLTRHFFIVGSTGSGKTVATLNIVKQLPKNIPFLIIEPVKAEYFKRLKSPEQQLVRSHFDVDKQGEEAELMKFDPLQLQHGVSVQRHVSYLKGCFESAFPMHPVQALVLENGLRTYYRKEIQSYYGSGDAWNQCLNFEEFRYCVYATVPNPVTPAQRKDYKIFPSWSDFQEYFLGTSLKEQFSAKTEKSEEWEQLFRRRFMNIEEGPLGVIFKRAENEVWGRSQKDINQRVQNGRNTSHVYLYSSMKVVNHTSFEKRLNNNWVVELDALTDPELKALMMAFLLAFLYENRQATGECKEPKHVLIIEEAHRILSRSAMTGIRGELAGTSASAKSVSMFIDMLAEIRAYGQGIGIVEQIPTKIVSDAIKNTSLKIMLRLPSKNDRDYLGEAMNLNEEQIQFASLLKQGQAIVFDETVDLPVLLEIPNPSPPETKENNHE